MDTTPLHGYKMGREIGAGSFAKVYLATTTTFPVKSVAVKSVLRSRLTQKLLENLESEISILKGIRHPHIVELMDITNTGSHIHLIMEYCPLGDLSFFIRKREKLGRPGQIPLLQEIATDYPCVPGAGLNEILVKHFLQQLASALQVLRSANLMHRDVKPQNLLLQPPPVSPQASGIGLPNLPVLKLADFGFARYLQTSSMAETLCGSPLYMAPEILRYEKYDATADLWSVGTVLFEMLVGKAPYRAQNHVELLRKIDQSDDHVKFPAEISFDTQLMALIRSLLRRNPKDRISFWDFFNHPVVLKPLETETRVYDAHNVLENSMMTRRNFSSGTMPISVPVRTIDNAERTHPSPAFITDLIPINTPPASQHPNSLTKIPYLPNRIGSNTSRPSISGQSPSYRRKDSHELSPEVPSDNRTDSPTREREESRVRKDLRSAHLTDLPTRIPSSRNVRNSEDEKERDRDSETDYVLIEKKTVEVNAFADAMARSPRPNQALRRFSSTLTRLSPSQFHTESSLPPPIGPNNATVQVLATAERRLGSSPSSALAKALNVASQRLFGGGSPPSWLEQMVNNAAQISGHPRLRGTKAEDSIWSSDSEALSLEEESLLKCIQGHSIKATVVCDFGELKLRQLIPPPPPSNSSENVECLLTNEAIVSLCEEALALFLKTLQLLQKNIDIVQEWMFATHGEHSRTAVKLNEIVQWTRKRYNEVLEKAEYLQRRRGVSLALVTSNYLFDDVTAERLLYDRALELGRGAAVHEIVGENLSQCEGDYEASVLMLEAILVTTPVCSSATDSALGDQIEAEDRQVIERWIDLTRARLYKLREKMHGMKAASISVAGQE